jgi:hypothetical protein
MNGKTVEMRLTIFPATSLKPYTDLLLYRWWIYCGARSRVGASTVPPPSLEAGLKRRQTTRV